MSDRYLYHVTTTTGHSRKSYRSEVGDTVVEVCRKLVDAMRDGSRIEIPGQSGYWCDARISGRCMSARIYAGSELIVAFAVAENERCGAALWRGLHNAENHAKTDPEKQPRAPWCGVSLTESFALHQDCWDWVGDFERCIAWGFLDGGK